MGNDLSVQHEKLVNSLLKALDKGDEKGERVRKLLGELLASTAGSSLLETLQPEVDTASPKPVVAAVRVADSSSDHWQTGPIVRRMSVNGRVIVVPEANISLVKEIEEKKRKKYVKNSRVPLKDFSRFMQGLADQFEGELAKIKDSKLKKLILPVMVPCGFGLSDMPDERADTAVLVTEGLWNGVILCSEVDEEAGGISEFTQARNGDVVGDGLWDDGEQVLLLNVVALLKREGFLAMV